MEKDIPPEWVNLYSLYQHNVLKFFNELDQIFAQYLEFILDLQQDWVNFWRIIYNPNLSLTNNLSENFEILSLKISPTDELKNQRRKVQKTKPERKHEILNQSLSKLPLY